MRLRECVPCQQNVEMWLSRTFEVCPHCGSPIYQSVSGYRMASCDCPIGIAAIHEAVRQGNLIGVLRDR